MLYRKQIYKVFKRDLIFTLILFFFLVSCAQTKVSPKQFVEPYKQAWLLDKNSRNRRLIQLGLPTNNSIAIWYLLHNDEKDKRLKLDKNDFEIFEMPTTTNNKDEKEICKEIYTIHHLHFKEHGSGRIEIVFKNVKNKDLIKERKYKIKLNFFKEEIIAWTAPKKPISFSFLAYSGFQPYAYKNDEPMIYKQTVHILNIMKNRANSRIIDGRGPSFILGIGDQVYIDPGATDCGNPFPLLRGWKSNKRRYYPELLPEYFNEIYRSHFAIPPFDAAHRFIPSGMMWDDHEIRDGWGSQGDEEDIDKELASQPYLWGKHMAAARRAFFAFQALRNPGLGNTSWNELYEDEGQDKLERLLKVGNPTMSKELYYQFEWGNATFFVLDLRSFRNYKSERVISDKQIEALKEWFSLYENEQNNNKLFVLVSTIPLTLGSEKPFGPLDLHHGDDINDKWSSKNNKYQREEIIKILVDYFKRHNNHYLLIVSGDIHASEIYYLKLYDNGRKERVFGHEIIASGLAQTDFDRTGLAGYLTQKPSHVLEKNKTIFKNYPRGKIAQPNFVEVKIEQSFTHEQPEVKILIYPARRSQVVCFPWWTKRWKTCFWNFFEYCKRLVNLEKSQPFFDDEYHKEYILSYNEVPRIEDMEKRGLVEKRLSDTLNFNIYKLYNRCWTEINAEEKAENWDEIKEDDEIKCEPYRHLSK